ncbi:MAG: ATP-dependent helicase [Myxococcales bacterium]|nr:ATP-dependent helicase [Myxococcales bacterium]
MSFEATTQQQAIIDLDAGCFLVEAPPGSGKTQVLTQRVRRLLSGPPQPFRVLALTFTTKAAETLRSRVSETLPRETSSRVTAETFHSFALSVLRAYGDRVGFAPTATIYERAADRRDALSQAIAAEGFAPRTREDLDKILYRISSEKRALRAPDEVSDSELATIYGAYQRTLVDSNACDFDDLLLLTWQVFDQHQRVAEHYRQIYRYILIDEAQDTSRVQFEILRALCGTSHRSVMLVADKSQGIYGFAGASTEFLEEFVECFSAQRLTLSHNFRSAQAIVHLANRLVVHDNRLRQPSIEATDAKGHVDAFVRNTEEAEAELVVQGVQELLKSGLRPEWLAQGEQHRVSAEEIAILGRSRFCLGAILAALSKRQIKHFLASSDEGLLESSAARLAIDCLRLLNNPRDRAPKMAIIKTWGLDGTSADEPLALLRKIQATDVGIAKLLLLFIQSIEKGGAVDVNSIVMACIGTLEEFAQRPSVGEVESAEADRLRADVTTLADRWAQYRGPIAPAQRSIGGFLGALALSGRSVIAGEGVRVMSIHAAKGLEFRAVFLVGMNEGTLPDFRADSEPKINEERRSAYVAVTRAARLLILTRSATRTSSRGSVLTQNQSRFIGEMGLEMKPREQAGASPPERA